MNKKKFIEVDLNIVMFDDDVMLDQIFTTSGQYDVNGAPDEWAAW